MRLVYVDVTGVDLAQRIVFFMQPMLDGTVVGGAVGAKTAIPIPRDEINLPWLRSAVRARTSWALISLGETTAVQPVTR